MPRSRSRLLAFSLALSVALTGSAGSASEEVSASPDVARSKDLGGDVFVRQLLPGAWLHVSFKNTDRAGRASANGLLVTTGEMSVMVDTGWTPDQTRRLVRWASDTLGQPVEHLIVTHFHEDRMGGLAAVAKLPIVVHGHAATARLLRKNGHQLHWTFEFEERLDLGGETVGLLYPGPGHAPDNIVVYFPRRQILYCGCLVKATADTSLGFLGDADLSTWPLGVRRVIERYREARVIVPGHGEPGGLELLSHSMELLEQAQGSLQEARP